MSPPIRDGSGNDIGSIRLGDGSEISEVRTGAGDVLFNAISDTGMFQSPIIHYNADSLDLSNGATVSSWIDQLNSTDVTADGAPTYQSDKSGFPSVFYDGNDDGHDLNNPPAFPSGTGLTVSFATTVFIPSANDGYMFWYGVKGSDGLSLEIQSDGTARLNASASGSPDHDTSYPTGEWCTIGGSIDGGANDWTIHVNKTHNTASYFDPDVDDSNHSMAYRTDGNDKFADLYLYDMVVSSSSESNTAFDDYHDNRI
jgi:hypothetical protein